MRFMLPAILTRQTACSLARQNCRTPARRNSRTRVRGYRIFGQRGGWEANSAKRPGGGRGRGGTNGSWPAAVCPPSPSPAPGPFRGVGLPPAPLAENPIPPNPCARVPARRGSAILTRQTAGSLARQNCRKHKAHKAQKALSEKSGKRKKR